MCVLPKLPKNRFKILKEKKKIMEFSKKPNKKKKDLHWTVTVVELWTGRVQIERYLSHESSGTDWLPEKSHW